MATGFADLSQEFHVGFDKLTALIAYSVVVVECE